MEEVLIFDPMAADEQDRLISRVFRQESRRLKNFILKRVPDKSDAEDILQETFYELVVAYRLVEPIGKVGPWLFRVARNRIIDRFRAKGAKSRKEISRPSETGEESVRWEDLLPSPEAGPEAAFARKILLEELDAALDELPEEQREVFIAHEIEGRSFKELAAATGSKVNTLLSRKHSAVLHLRKRLRAIYEEFQRGA
jgi:RNA polymerase sigma factor (sigma-70 family)